MAAVAALELDTELMLRVREGDAEGFEALLGRYRGPVVHFLYRMVRNQPVAEELAQEVFLRVYRSRGSYEPADGAPSIEEAMVRRTRLEEVRRAIQALPEKQRVAVLMHKYEEMDYAQIARILGCSEPAVKSLPWRVYETLRARLAQVA